MNSGGVRAKYLSYTPEDVEKIEDLDTLRWLCDKYNLPSSQPQTVEEATYQCIITFHLSVKIDRLTKKVFFRIQKCFLIGYMTFSFSCLLVSAGAQ